jgi:hypothetical protein
MYLGLCRKEIHTEIWWGNFQKSAALNNQDIKLGLRVIISNGWDEWTRLGIFSICGNSY